jgi:hypothetical protein
VKGIVKKMDPAYVYQFAQTEGFYHDAAGVYF